LKVGGWGRRQDIVAWIKERRRACGKVKRVAF